jgi:hypothetical protein
VKDIAKLRSIVGLSKQWISSPLTKLIIVVRLFLNPVLEHCLSANYVKSVKIAPPPFEETPNVPTQQRVLDLAHLGLVGQLANVNIGQVIVLIKQVFFKQQLENRSGVKIYIVSRSVN